MCLCVRARVYVCVYCKILKNNNNNGDDELDTYIYIERERERERERESIQNHLRTVAEYRNITNKRRLYPLSREKILVRGTRAPKNQEKRIFKISDDIEKKNW